MQPTSLPPVVRRALAAVALFTLAAWWLIVALVLAWAPGRSVAAGLAARVAQAVTAQAAAVPEVAGALSGVVLPCSNDSGFAYDDGAGDSHGFAWCLVDGAGEVWIDGTGSRHRAFTGRPGEARFWFRDGNDEFEVTDPALVAEVRDAARPLRDIGREMGELGSQMGRDGARLGRIGGRLGLQSARVALIEARLAERSGEDRRDENMERDLRELRSQLAELRARMEAERAAHLGERRALASRMRELSARRREMLRSVRERVRGIAERARRQGKAERPHVNA